MCFPFPRRDKVHGHVHCADHAAHVAVGAAEIEHGNRPVAGHGGHALDHGHCRPVNADQAGEFMDVYLTAGHGHVIDRDAARHHREVEGDSTADAGVDAHNDAHAVAL